MTLKVTEFDGAESSHTNPIHLIMNQIKLTAPAGAKVEWQYPGYISIVLENGTEIAFGESLENNSQYSWNDFDREGTNTFAGSFDDLGNVDSIVNELWRQVAPVLESQAK
jgi:hypothetical protein